MGIQKINKYLIKVEEECAIKGIEKAYLSNISGCRLAIDAYMFIYQALYNNENNYLISILNLIIKFYEYDIIPIFVFDGKPPKEKKRVTVNRQNIKIRSKHKIRELKETLNQIKKCDDNKKILSKESIKNNKDIVKKTEEQIIKLNKKCISIKKHHIDNIKLLLNYLNIQYIHLNYEADIICSELVKQQYADAVLSNDMDLLAYNCPIIIRNLNLKTNTILIYNLAKILNNLNLTNKQITQLIIMLGCDYSRSLGISCDDLHQLILKYDNNINNIINYINDINISKNKSIIDYTNYKENYNNCFKIFYNLIKIYPENIINYTIHKKWNHKLNNKLNNKLNHNKNDIIKLLSNSTINRYSILQKLKIFGIY